MSTELIGPAFLFSTVFLTTLFLVLNAASLPKTRPHKRRKAHRFPSR
ncbi:MAG: hypothetical protein QNK37_06330 [Acidobacteriota bacterium]|nr:hypothetical protein [Acidobacteriota bacterium]